MKNSAAVPSGALAKRRVRNLIKRSFVARRVWQCQAEGAVLARSLVRIRCCSEDDAVVAGVPPGRLENCSRHGCLYTRMTSWQRVPPLVNEKGARFFKYLVEFFGAHFSD